MTSVTIDLEDLETLVMTTGALKMIEGALAQRKTDPFVRQHLDFTAAHDRCASVMRNARRAEAGTLVPWDGALDEVEEQLLRDLDHTEMGERGIGLHKVDYDSLAAKGCVVIGQQVGGVKWADDNQPHLRIIPSLFHVKITQRGREKLANIDARRVMTEDQLVKGLQDLGLCGND